MITLVLGSGSARGLAHIGVIKVLEEHNLIPDLVVGTSAGSIIASMYCAGKLWDFEREIRKSNKKQIMSLFKTKPSKMGLVRHYKIRKLFESFLDKKRIEDLDKRLAIIATNIKEGSEEVFMDGRVIDAVLASTSIPGLFVPMKINDEIYVDGGIVDPLPTKVARRLNKRNVIIAVNVVQKKQNFVYGQNLFKTIIDSANLSGYKILLESLKYADVLIEPNTKGIGPMDYHLISKIIPYGEKAARKKINDIKLMLKLKGWK